MLAKPAQNGAPVSSLTYKAPSGPRAIAVGTESVIGGKPGNVHDGCGGTVDRDGKTATVDSPPERSCSPPASVTSARPPAFSRPKALLSTGPRSGLFASS